MIDISNINIAIISGSLVLVGGVFVYLYFRRPFLDSLNLQVLLVKVKQKTDKEEKNNLIQEINVSEQLFNSLSSIKKPFVFETAVHHVGEGINFYLAVPRSHVDFAKRQVQGLFLEAQVEEAGEYTIFNAQSETVGAYLKMTENKIIPLRTYRESEVDTFSPILSTLSKLQENGDGAAIQLIVCPADKGAKKDITSALERLKKGEKFSDVVSDDSVWKILRELFFDKKKTEEDKPKPVDEEGVKSLQLKISKPLFKVNVRMVASSSTPGRAEEILLSMAASFSQFTAAMRNSFKIVKPRNLKKLIFAYVFREFNANEQCVLNSEELASIFHLPTFSTDVPRVSWIRTNEVPPPANLPNEGTVIGENVFRGDHKLVKMTDNDRRRHFYIIGQTGVGKSYLMINMAVQDMQNGKGLCIIDPHGSLVDEVVERVPRDRIEDVIYFDPGDLRRPMGLNMLEYDFNRPEEKTFIVNELQSIFNRLFSQETMGPMFEQYMRNTLLLLMEDAKNEPATLVEVPRVLTDAEYRNKKLARIANPTVIDFWVKEASKATGDVGLQNMAPYITSKFGNFISNDYMRPIIGQTTSAFNFRKVMDEGKILLVNLSKGRIGDINANLLGMIFTGRILMAALGRNDIAEADRRDFYLYIDEFQNFTTDSISQILAEARKYKLDLIIAHQYIKQLEDNIREAVFGNVGSLAAFRVGTTDTEVLLKQFAPEFSEKDLISVENQHAFAKLLVNGEPTRPFSFQTLRAEPGSAEVREKLKELSRLTYGQDLAEVEQDVLRRLRS